MSGSAAEGASRARIEFAPADDVAIRYVDRTREYYQALGFAPSRWPPFPDPPFTPLGIPLARARVALITTAAPLQPEAGDQGPRAPYTAAAEFYQVYPPPVDAKPDLRIAHVGYDRANTTPEDLDAYFPLGRLHDAVAARPPGGLPPRLPGAAPPRGPPVAPGGAPGGFRGAPPTRSRGVTMEPDPPGRLRRCREDGADAAVLVPS